MSESGWPPVKDLPVKRWSDKVEKVVHKIMTLQGLLTWCRLTYEQVDKAGETQTEYWDETTCKRCLTKKVSS